MEVCLPLFCLYKVIIKECIFIKMRPYGTHEGLIFIIEFISNYVEICYTENDSCEIA